MVIDKSQFALVCPGQGAQAVGMGRDLYQSCAAARRLFDRADRLLGFPLTKAMFEGPETALVDTAVQQPALVAVSLAVLRALEEVRGAPLAICACAGLSLGEYAALAAAGALSEDDALLLVRRRGQLMQEAASSVKSGMAVVLQLDAGKVQDACAQATRETGAVAAVCNFNGGGQFVIGGAASALACAMELCRAAGGRVLRLPVAGAFHTALMQPAADRFKADLDRASFSRARVPVIANVSAEPVQEPEEIRAALARQLTSPVRWEQTVQWLVAAGCGSFVEAGSGKSLAGLIRRIAPQAVTRSLGTWQDVCEFARQAG